MIDFKIFVCFSEEFEDTKKTLTDLKFHEGLLEVLIRGFVGAPLGVRESLEVFFGYVGGWGSV